MNRDAILRMSADLILIAHGAFAGFVVFGWLLIVMGGVRRWKWIRNPWFRVLHLAAIGVVVAQSWIGAICPLTTMEMRLRGRIGDPTYSGAFVAHWLQKLLYCDAPAWVFVVTHSLFGLAVAGSWLAFPPRAFRSGKGRIT